MKNLFINSTLLKIELNRLKQGLKYNFVNFDEICSRNIMDNIKRNETNLSDNIVEKYLDYEIVKRGYVLYNGEIFIKEDEIPKQDIVRIVIKKDQTKRFKVYINKVDKLPHDKIMNIPYMYNSGNTIYGEIYSLDKLKRAKLVHLKKYMITKAAETAQQMKSHIMQLRNL